MPSVPEAGRCTGAPAGLPRNRRGGDCRDRSELLLRDFADVARSMSEEASWPVTPPRDGNQFQDRNAPSDGLDEVNIALERGLIIIG